MYSELDELLDTAPARPRRARRPVVIAGIVLIAIGLGLLGYVGWEYFGTNIVSRHKQAQLRTQLAEDWGQQGTKGDSTRDAFGTGDAMAIVRIPRFGADYAMPLVNGVDDASLAKGIGWFPHSARPGQVGNFAIAGHRVTHGEPFRRFPELKKGDEVTVETRTHIYTYTLTGDGADRVVDASEGWLVDSIPGRSGLEPDQALLTMVTCSDLFHTANRLVVLATSSPPPTRTADQPRSARVRSAHHQR